MENLNRNIVCGLFISSSLLLGLSSACDQYEEREELDLDSQERALLDPNEDDLDAEGIIIESDDNRYRMEHEEATQRGLAWYLEDCRWGYRYANSSGGNHGFSDDDYKIVSAGCGLPGVGTIIGLQMALQTYGGADAHGSPIPDGTALRNIPGGKSGNVACHNWFPASGVIEYSGLFCRNKYLDFGFGFGP